MFSNAGNTVAVNRPRSLSEKLDDLLFLMLNKDHLIVTVCFKLNCWLILLVFRLASPRSWFSYAYFRLAFLEKHFVKLSDFPPLALTVLGSFRWHWCAQVLRSTKPIH